MHHLPMRLPHAIIVATVWSDVLAPRTFSRSFMTFAGEKKCVPMTRSGRDVTDAISSILRYDVLLQRNAEGLQILSSSAKISFLTSISSNTASTTMSQSASEVSAVDPVIRPLNCAFWSTERRLERSKLAWIILSPLASPASLTSTSLTTMPTSAHDIAIPPPMSPAPTIPTVEILAALARMPSTFTPVRSAKNMWRRAADSGDLSNTPNSRFSTLSPTAKVGPAHAASTHRTIAAGAISPGRILASLAVALAKSVGCGGGMSQIFGSGNPILDLHTARAVLSRSLPLATIVSTTFHLSAWSAPMCAPDVIISMAASGPMSRGSRCVPCPPGNRPMLTSGNPSFAEPSITL
mmetsp:Transcript_22713/g.59291  ORF Transcript_22713/g.59291 Transcript_22713/m.59291 type:complete len:351 (-) Transcript_22713:502-1554(-)